MATSSAGIPVQIPEGLAISQTEDCDLSDGHRWTDVGVKFGFSSETCFMASLWGRREDRSYMNKIYCETEVLVPSLESSDWTDALEDKYEYNHYMGPFLSKQTWFRLQSPRSDKPCGSDPYLFREEYKKLIKDIEKHWTAWHTGVQEARGTVLLGWPGIGKSIFLKIFLAHLLLDSKPVIMSDPGGETFCAFDGGSDGKGRVRIVRTNCLVPFVEANRHFTHCIVLCDSTSSLPTGPPYQMTTDNHGSNLRFWVVQATSPKESQWKAWKVRSSAQIWCMMPCDWREIWAVSCGLMGMDTELAKKAYTQLGPGIRQVRNVKSKNEKALASDTQYLRCRVESICTNSVTLRSALISAAGQTSFVPSVVDELPNLLFLPVPSQNDRQRILLLTPSKGVFNHLVARLDCLQASQVEEVRRLLLQDPNSRPLYRQLFENQCSPELGLQPPRRSARLIQSHVGCVG